jgi:polyhydroxyalkanoate synthesis regulator protein
MADYFAQNTYTTRKGKTRGGLDYSKFDSIGREFDDSPRVSPSLEAARGLPPELQLALAESQAAQTSGDPARIAASLQSFEDKLQRAPPEFQKAMQSARAHRASSSLASSPPQASNGLEAQFRDADAVSAKLDSAFSLTEGIGDDMAGMAEFLASTGLTEEDLLKAENSSDPAEAMRRLAEIAVNNTLGGARGSTANKAAAKPESTARKGGSTKKGVGGSKIKNARATSGASSGAAGSASGGGSSDGMPESLQAMVRARDEAQAELERQRASVAKAKAAAERTRAELRIVEDAKKRQGDLIDASVAQVCECLAVLPSTVKRGARNRLLHSTQEGN